MTASAVSARTWSAQQEAVFSFIIDARGNLVVRARAGTGKTTTIVEAVLRWLAANPGLTVLVCAFNKRIEKELKARFFGVRRVEVKTLHGVGFAACRRYCERLVVEEPRKVFEVGGKLRKDALAKQVCGSGAPDAIVRLVAKLHTLARETAPHATQVGELTNLAIEHECQPDATWDQTPYGGTYVEHRALQAMALAAEVQSGDTIDYADMIFLPCRWGWMANIADLVVVDEAQDMTTAQLELAVGSTNPNGRIVVVGDDRQAIYGFRGADSDSLNRLKAELQAQELSLTTTYRCGRAIVDLAREIVPDFEAGPSNHEGVVRDMANDFTHRVNLVIEVGPGDFVLSRVNAPLVSTAMKLLRAGKRARVAGVDIGKGLVTLIKKLKARSVPDLLARIEGWSALEVSRHSAALVAAKNGHKRAIEAKVEAIRDQSAMLTSLVDGARSVDEVVTRIEHLFADDGLGDKGVITCSSVHKSKGLEADRVFLLADTFRGGTKEEDNIRYVAITRAKRELVWVYGNEEERQ